MRNSLIDKSHDIKKLLEAILLNVHSTDSIQLHDGKSGLSLCLFEVANYLDDQLIEDKALHVLPYF